MTSNDGDDSTASDAYGEDQQPYTAEESLWNDSDTDDGSDIDPNEPIGDVQLEVVGLNSSSNGRSCTVHSVCGCSVRVGDVLRLIGTTVTVDGRLEGAVKLVKIVSDGVEGCVVAYIPRAQLDTPTVLRNVNGFCMVKELYQNRKFQWKREKSHLGMAGVVLLNEIPRFE
jgi:hypothetical protein